MFNILRRSNNTLKTQFFLACFLFVTNNCLYAQTSNNVRIHSHNDYEQRIPLYGALQAGATSIEIDVHLNQEENQLYVAHDRSEILPNRTITSIYFEPLLRILEQWNEEKILQNEQQIQLLIDIKSDWEASIPVLIEQTRPILHFIDGSKASIITVVITGNMPPPSEFHKYPEWLQFDGRFENDYSEEQLKRIALFSASFKDVTLWGGKGRPVEKEHQAITNAIIKAHSLNKPIRFWATPDSKTSWSYLLNNGVDFINTDKPADLKNWLSTRVKGTTSKDKLAFSHSIDYKIPENVGKAKNVILFINDGMGLAQLQAAQTVAGGELNMTKSLHLGLVKTQSTDAYSTDSAAGATAFATGFKTKNRALGVNEGYDKGFSIIEKLAAKNVRTAIITTDSFDGATPAAFYAHQNDRDNYKGIGQDFINSPLDGIISTGKLPDIKGNAKIWSMSEGNRFSSFKEKLKQAAFIQENDALDIDWLSSTMKSNLDVLANSQGFFLMVEGAKVDNGGHANDLAYLVQELLLVDKAIGEASDWAATNGETLIIVTADHETGGLVVFDGNEKMGMAEGTFYSDDHTGIMVPLFAFGPESELFNGIYENTEVHFKILKALGFE